MVTLFRHLTGDLPCDFVILATGAAACRGLAGLGWTLPMANKRGMILQTQPVQTRIRHILMTPDVHFRQNPDGSLVAGEIFSGDLDPSADVPALAETVIARIRQNLRGQPDVQLAQVKLGERPVPLDGLPVVGAVPGAPGIFMAVMHSGVTLGPLVGQLLAKEILHGRSSPLLSKFSSRAICRDLEVYPRAYSQRLAVKIVRPVLIKTAEAATRCARPYICAKI